MADIEPPSFSLGLDLDFDKPLELDPLIGNKQDQNEKGKERDIEEEEEFQFRVSDSDPDSPAPKFRRLRRGYGPSFSKPISRPTKESQPLPTSSVLFDDDNDDDIEEFSSEELVRTDDLPAPQHHSVCSSSKIPLSGYGILKNQKESKVLNRKRKQDSNCPPTSLGPSIKGKSVLSDLTASPPRRFQLLDSDSDFDDPSEDVHLDRGASEVGCSKQNGQKESIQDCHQITRDRQTVSSTTPISQKQDLWNDFYAEKRCAVPTPAFDDFFKEYYATKQNSGVPGSAVELCSSGQGKSNNYSKKSIQHQDVESADPPSHRYFFHDDLRIQSLVRSRLPYFCPLISLSDPGNKPCNASAIDYMSQFGHGDTAKKQPGRQANARKSSRSAGKKTKNSNAANTSHASGEWINPKQTNTPKDAGRRRVRAESGSAGHWFTSENGKKVYVSSTGKELTGRLAYRLYRKESGKGAKGYKRSKKKSVSKKK